jgi:hypothetical protein
MIDMNASIEEIMNECDYIAEVKGEAEADYSYARHNERRTNDHTFGKNYSKNARNFRNNEDRLVKPHMKTAEDYRSRECYAKEDRKHYDKEDKNHDKKIFKKISNDYDKRHANESASIFDPLFNQI